EVDDLLQEVFLLALRQLHSLRDASRFGPWLGTITRNRANDYFRKTIRRESVDAPTGSDAVPEIISSDAASREAAEILALVRDLPEAYREPLLMRLVEGMSGPEIAARTGLKHGSVRVNLFRGMQLLREKLGRSTSGPA